MKQTLLQDKYPVFIDEIPKSETSCRNIDDVVDYFKGRIAENERVQLIGVFDHYAHTKRVAGEIGPGIQAAVDVIFCFGYFLPNPQVLALRPRSIGIADMGDRFVVSFMEAPMPPANLAMESWVKELRNKT
jgi:Family of unknown function (DUF6858)